MPYPTSMIRTCILVNFGSIRMVVSASEVRTSLTSTSTPSLQSATSVGREFHTTEQIREHQRQPRVPNSFHCSLFVNI
jgi:hypothetical protein